jgi:hypothetical protein
VGAVSFPRLVAAIGPYWRADADLAAVRVAVRDYCGLVMTGKAAPYASPTDLAKKLGALIGNAKANALDALGRFEGAERIIHGYSPNGNGAHR